MKKVIFEQHGFAPEVIEVIDTPEAREPGPGEVKLSLIASPINPSDLLTVAGDYGLRPVRVPSGVGKEALGKVIAVGPEVADIAVGGIYYYAMGNNTWMEQAVVPASVLIPVPAQVDPLQLCMSVGNPLSAYLMLKQYVSLKEGDWLIQNAANSAVGTNVITLAREWGLKTVNIVRREELVEPLTLLGADVVLVSKGDMVDAVQQATDGATIQLALDAIAGPATQQLAELLGYGGTIVNYGLLSGEDCRLSPKFTVFNGISLTGFWLQPWMLNAPQQERAEALGYVLELVSRGTIQVPVEAHFPLEQAREAVTQAAMEGRKGKVVITGPAFEAY